MNFYYTIVVVKDLYRESLLDEDEKEKESKKWVMIKMLRFPIAQITVLIIASCNRVSFMFTNKYNKNTWKLSNHWDELPRTVVVLWIWD